MKKAVIGILDTRADAESAVARLQRIAEIGVRDISVLFPDRQGSRDFAHEHSTKAPEGAAIGAGAGGTVGGVIGALAGIGALAIPGLGPLIAAGPLLGALSGVAAGAAFGGLTGVLVGMGVPEIEAKTYEGKLRSGNILIAVHTESRDAQKEAREVLQTSGAHDVSVTSEASVPRESR